MNCDTERASLKELIPEQLFCVQDPLPTHGIVSITNRCNLACPYCFHQ